MPAAPKDPDGQEYYFTIVNDKGGVISSGGISIVLEATSDKIVENINEKGEVETTLEGGTFQISRSAFSVEAPFDNSAKNIIVYRSPNEKLISVDLTEIEDNSMFGLSRNGKTIMLSNEGEIPIQEFEALLYDK